MLSGRMHSFREDSPAYDLEIEDETVELYPLFRQQAVQQGSRSGLAVAVRVARGAA